MRTWHPILIDTAGIRYVPTDAAAHASLAAIPGPSLLTVDAEAGLLAAGLRPVRNHLGILVAIQIRSGALYPFVPDVGPGEP